jgi:hypothetical protein
MYVIDDPESNELQETCDRNDFWIVKMNYLRTLANNDSQQTDWSRNTPEEADG